MIVYVLGNPELPEDSLPLRLLPDLKRRLPQMEFAVKDPNEEWDVPEELAIIDTVVGIAEPRVFDSLDAFTAAPTMTVHDFDAYANLRLLQKLGRLKKVTVIGLPAAVPDQQALEFAVSILK